MIGVQDKQTLDDYEQAALQFHQLAVLPWVVRIEQEANKKLLPKVGNRRPFLKINTAAIVRANLEAQYRAFALGRQWGWLSANDVRKLIDLEPIGEDGDVYLQPTSMSPVEELPPAEEGETPQQQPVVNVYLPEFRFEPVVNVASPALNFDVQMPKGGGKRTAKVTKRDERGRILEITHNE